jgi:hypothetical protein
MRGNALISLGFSLFVVLFAVFSGCSDEPAPEEPALTTPVHPDAKYAEGDIVATVASAASSSLYLILKYDAATDQYTRTVIEKNADGSWGYRPSDRTEKVSRAALERTYTVRAGHVAVSIVPVITPAVPTEVSENPSGDAPVITKISPVSATKDAIVSLTISGSGFRNGATVRLFRAGSSPLNGTVTAVTAFDLSCYFDLHGRNEGSYNLIVTNPDGQSDSRQDAFTIGSVGPVIAGVYPVNGTMNQKVPLTISGQNFRTEVKVSFSNNQTELVCDNPLSMESSRIVCTLDLGKNRGAFPGEWTVTIINIRDGMKGTWVKKFTIANVTGTG